MARPASVVKTMYSHVRVVGDDVVEFVKQQAVESGVAVPTIMTQLVNQELRRQMRELKEGR